MTLDDRLAGPNRRRRVLYAGIRERPRREAPVPGVIADREGLRLRPARAVRPGAAPRRDPPDRLDLIIKMEKMDRDPNYDEVERARVFLGPSFTDFAQRLRPSD